MPTRMNAVAATMSLLLASAAVAQSHPSGQQTGSMNVQQTPMPTTTPQSTAPGQAGTAPGQAGTTPGQEQTTPGEASTLTPAVTGQTPSGQTTAKGAATSEAAQTKVTKADVKAGAEVYDSAGNAVGKIESVTAKGVVLNTGTVSVTIPLSGLAKGEKGLVIGMSKAEIEAAAKKSS